MLDYIKPMLPAELSRPFDNIEWLFEKNHGGFRAITVISDGNINIFSNKNQVFNNDFPQLIKELGKLPNDIILDGEIVMLNEEGNPDIQKLLNYKNNPHLAVRYYLFDLLNFKGLSLLKTPLIDRKNQLHKLLKQTHSPLYLSDYVLESGCDLYATAIRENLEGINAKKLDSLYYPGKISSEWLKIHKKSQPEIYICGFTKPAENNNGIGSIIAGFKENNTFYYSGHIAAGLDNLYVQELYTQLISLVTEKSPFKTEIKSKKDIVWVQPVLKCEVKYLELTKDYHMRQPVLVSLINE